MFAPLASAPHVPSGKATRLARRSLALVAGAALLGVAAQLPASAAPTDAKSTTANVQVDSAISLTGLTSAFTLRGASESTVTEADAVAYNVKTNNVGGYAVTVQATAATLAAATTGNTDAIPIANLKVRAHGTGNFSPVSDTSAVTVRTKSTKSVAVGDNYTDDYQVDIPFVNSDTYSTTLNYIASAT